MSLYFRERVVRTFRAFLAHVVRRFLRPGGLLEGGGNILLAIVVNNSSNIAILSINLNLSLFNSA